MSVKRIGITAFLILVLASAMTLASSEATNLGNHPHGANVALAAASVSSVKGGNWSDPSTWSSGVVPASGDSVNIRSGHTVTYNVLSDIVLGEVRVEGTLRFARNADTRLKLSGNLLVMSGGYLDMGTVNDIIPRNIRAEIIWALSQVTANSYVGGPSFQAADKGLWAMSGSRWETHGAPLVRTWSKLAQDAQAGSNTIVVENNVSDWYTSGYLVITPTNMPRSYYIRSSDNREFSDAAWEGETRQIVQLQALSGGKTRITLDRPLDHTHLGTDPIRAAVGHLTRNILFTTEIAGANLSDLDPLLNERLYAHTMLMHGSTGNFSYAEFRRMGHYNTLARYPVHLHMMGNDFVNKVQPGSGVVIRGNSVWISGHRWYVIHDTNGALVEDNVGFNGFDHGYYLEKTNPITNSKFCRDCPQGPHDNVFSHNLGVYARETQSSGVASNFWLDHLDQILVGNFASGGGLTISGVGANDDLKGGGFGTSEIANGSGEIQVPLFIKNEAVSNFANGLWTWNNNVPSNMAIIEFSAIRNGASGMLWGAYASDYRFYQSQFIENGRFGLNVTSVHTHLQDTLVQGGSSSGSSIDKGFHIGNYVAPASPNGPVRLIRTTFKDHRSTDLDMVNDQCSDPVLEKLPVVAGLISKSCGAVYLDSLGSQFLSATPLHFGHTANANSFWRFFDRNGFPDQLYMRPDQLNSSMQGVITQRLVNSQTRYDGNADALVTPMSSYPSQGVKFSNLIDERGNLFSYTFTPSPDYPPEAQLTVSKSGSAVTMLANVTDDHAVDRIEFFVDEEKVGEGNSLTVDLSGRDRKFAYLYICAFDNKGQVSYSKVMEIGSEIQGPPSPPPTPTNQAPIVDAGPDVTITLPAAASLDSTVNDDGLPNPPGSVTTQWSQVSGPASVSFANPAATDTTATFSDSGTYVLKLTASDSNLSSSDEVAITVNPAPQPTPAPTPQPTPAPTPQPGAPLVSSLSVASGRPYEAVNNGLKSGAPVFIDRSYTFTAVPGSVDGSTYIKTANGDKSRADSAFLSFQVNQDVRVYVAYDHRASSLPNWLNSWNTTGESIGTTDVSFDLFSKDFAASSTVTLGGNQATGASGTDSNYFVAVVSQGASTPPAPANQAPIVDAGPDVTITLPGTASLDSAVSDDGLPNPPASVTTQWSQVSGPASVSFANLAATDTTATFSDSGVYILKLTASDSALSSSDEVAVTVNPAPQPTPAPAPQPTPAPTPQPTPAPTPQPGAPLVSSLSVASGKSYEAVNNGLKSGAPVFIDRSYTFTAVPGSVDGSTYIKTANGDKSRADSAFLSFQVNQDVRVYVAYDHRASSLPNWLNSWNTTGESIGTTDVSFDLFSKDFAASSTVTLGGNQAAGASGAESNYFVAVVPR